MNGKLEVAMLWPDGSAEQAKKMLDEMGPLLEKYWLEERPDPSWVFDLDVEGFVKSWGMRALLICQARMDGRIVAFSVSGKNRGLLTRNEQVVTSIMYIDPEHRKGDVLRQMLAYGKDMAAAMGVKRWIGTNAEGFNVYYKAGG